MASQARTPATGAMPTASAMSVGPSRPDNLKQEALYSSLTTDYY